MGDEVTNWLDLTPRPIDVAIHEAAHIISNYKLGMPLPEGASIIPEGKCLGRVALTWIKPWSEDVQFSEQPDLTHSYFGRNLICLLSGYAANFRHRRNTKINSRQRVQALVQVYPPEGGGGVEGDDVLLAFFCVRNFDPDEDIRKSMFLDAWDYTWDLVRVWWPDIKHVANVLLERKSLTRGELNTLVYETISPLTGGRDMRLAKENLRLTWENWKGKEV